VTDELIAAKEINMNDLIQLDPEYKKFLQELKQKVVSARMRTMLTANAEQIRLYWEIGRDIIERQKIVLGVRNY